MSLRRLEDEMLVTHVRPPAQERPAGDDRADRPAEAAVDRTALRRQLLTAADAEERAAIIRAIQNAFGNEVAEEMIREARISRGPEPADPPEGG